MSTWRHVEECAVERCWITPWRQSQNTHSTKMFPVIIMQILCFLKIFDSHVFAGHELAFENAKSDRIAIRFVAPPTNLSLKYNLAWDISACFSPKNSLQFFFVCLDFSFEFSNARLDKRDSLARRPMREIQHSSPCFVPEPN